jgi:predicted DNA-binding transcriptional regulator AlpA
MPYVAKQTHENILNNSILRRQDAAKYIGCSVSYLNKKAVTGDGPPMIRFSRKMIGYYKSDIDRWIEERRVSSTSETTQPH